jgi:hypothetical protein
MNASEFIRSRPASLSPKAVVQEGKEFGIRFTEALVDTVRFAEKQKLATTESLKSRLLAFCIEYVREHGKGPTGSEIAHAVGTPVGGISSTMRVLKRTGILDWEAGDYSTMTIDTRRLPPKGGTSNGTATLGLVTSSRSDALRAEVLAFKADLTEQFELLRQEFEKKIAALDGVLLLLP